MLQSLSEKLQGWVAWSIIVLICVTLAFFGIETYSTSRGSHEAAITVNGTPITAHQISRAVDALKRQQKSVGDNLPDAAIENMAIQQLTANIVMEQTAS